MRKERQYAIVCPACGDNSIENNGKFDPNGSVSANMFFVSTMPMMTLHGKDFPCPRCGHAPMYENDGNFRVYDVALGSVMMCPGGIAAPIPDPEPEPRKTRKRAKKANG